MPDRSFGHIFSNYNEEAETSTASEDFKDNILGRKRYVDKTDILIPLLRRTHESTFFLRPRRFGKTLTLSMIRYFLEDTRDEALNEENRSLFRGRKIMSAGGFYTSHMTSYPVISITLQGVKGKTYKAAYRSLLYSLQREYLRHTYVLESDRIEEVEKEYFRKILSAPLDEEKLLPEEDAAVALLSLSAVLRKVHGRRTVVLIDEYDVPLEKAYFGGYYRDMAAVVSPLLQNVLKTNSENILFAVVTGCLRIAKESIYTGLNNPEINTVLSDGMSTMFGFTEEEVKNLLLESGFPEHFEEIREWYDGYRFGQSGKSVIYNPWSVIRRIEALGENPASIPGTPWAGTSSNAIIRDLAQHGSLAVKEKAEALMRGEAIAFRERDNIVYEELNYHDDNVFDVMLHAGYLTSIGFDGEKVSAVIPNREVLKIYRDQVSEWFKGTLVSFDAGKLYGALLRGDPQGAEEVQFILNTKFLASMSYFDSREAFYHGILLALLQLNDAYLVDSNRESGKGRFDIECREKGFREKAIILEVKASRASRSLYPDAARAAGQARTKQYASQALREGYRSVYVYGISFFEKDCAVRFGGRYTINDLEKLTARRRKRNA